MHKQSHFGTLYEYRLLEQLTCSDQPQLLPDSLRYSLKMAAAIDSLSLPVSNTWSDCLILCYHRHYNIGMHHLTLVFNFDVFLHCLSKLFTGFRRLLLVQS